MHDATMMLRNASKGDLNSSETPTSADDVTVYLPESTMLDLWAEVLCPQSVMGTKLTAILEATDVPADAQGNQPWQTVAEQVISPVTMVQPDSVFVYNSLEITAPNAAGEYAGGTAVTNYSDITLPTLASASFLHFFQVDAYGNNVKAGIDDIADGDVIALMYGPDEWASFEVTATAANTSGKLSIDVTGRANETASSSVVAAGSVRDQPVLLLHWRGDRDDEIQVKLPMRNAAPFWRLRFDDEGGASNFGRVVATAACEGPFSLGTRHLPQPNFQVYGPPDWYREGSGLYGDVRRRLGINDSEISV